MNSAAIRFKPGVLAPFLLCVVPACHDMANNNVEKNDLKSLPRDQVTIRSAGGDATRSSHTYHVWLALTSDQQQHGLMNVTHDELPPDGGMLFVFPDHRYRSFWMHNTIIPLDIAYIRGDGVIVKIYTMTPLDESGYFSVEPAQFALEVRGGQFAEKGIREGDIVEIPPSIVNSASGYSDEQP